MVLRPLESAPRAEAVESGALPPAWSVIAERQKRTARAYWLISQPDHAALSGELAANFVSPRFPRIEPLVARAIGLHDSGWAMFEAEASASAPPMTTLTGKPLSFIEFAPEQFLSAWAGSIARAEAVSPAGGIMVSRHFCELGRFRLKTNDLPEAGLALVRQFIAREHERQQLLLPACTHSAQELDALLGILQFCDLCSLYLCSGAEHEVEFPQRIAERAVGVRREGQMYRFDPSPFQNGGAERVVSLGVRARYFPANGEPKLTRLEFLLA